MNQEQKKPRSIPVPKIRGYGVVIKKGEKENSVDEEKKN